MVKTLRSAKDRSLASYAKRNGVKFFLVSFVDLFGTMRAKLVPASAIRDVEGVGAAFAGFAAWLDLTPAHPDVFAVPDPDSLTQLPWKPEVAWVASDLYMDGKAIEHAPRMVLKRAIERAQAKGLRPRHGVECEYFVLDGKQDGALTLSDPYDSLSKPCYDQQALMRRYQLIATICDSMEKLGWGPYQNDHEDANGQFEMNWSYDDSLRTADRHAFFKYMVKSVAESQGLRATFMPKPFEHLTGNGCHVHFSLWDKAGKKNLFADSGDDLKLSKSAYSFIGGLLANGQAICAVTNPTVNSYKRLNAPPPRSGATWSPASITYGANDRTRMIRIPDAGRFELRLPDGAANPYLLPAAILAAGLDGIERDLAAGPPTSGFGEGSNADAKHRLPTNLQDALRAFEANKAMRETLGDELVSAYVKLRGADWQSFMSHFTRWEVENAIDC